MTSSTMTGTLRRFARSPRARSARRAWALALCGAALALMAMLCPTPSLAAEKAAADALFREGRQLMREGKIDQACEKFAGSMKVEPSVGALVNLARCHEKQGKTATAHSEYKTAAEMADIAGQPKRAAAARDLGAALEPKLCWLTVKLIEPEAAVRVTVDGQPIGRLQLGKAMPVDPGTHRIEATASGSEPWSTTIEVVEAGDRKDVAIPPLGQTGADETGTSTPRDPTSLGDEREEGSFVWSGQHIAAVVTGGVGVVGVVLGIVFGTQASSTWDEALSYCNNEDLNACSAQAGPLSDDASTYATVSTVGLVVGGAAVATGLILWLTAPSGSGQADASEVALRLAPLLGPTATGMAVTGSF